MAKRIKHSNIVNKATDASTSDIVKSDVDKPAVFIESTMSKEQVKKVADYDDLEKRYNTIQEEKSNLIDTIAGYLDEIKELKDKINNINDDKKNVKSEINKLTKEIQNLQEENDNYLVKISELSFENAKLMSQLQDVSNNHVDTSGNNVGIPEIIQPGADTYNPYKNNGYDSWN